MSGLIWVHAVCEGHQQTKQSMQIITNCFVAYACDHTSVILKNACKHTFVNILLGSLGLNEIYVWFLLPTYPNFFNPTLNIKMVFGEKIPKMGTFSDFFTIFFVNCYNKI